MTLQTARSYDGFLKIYHKRESRWKEKALQIKGKFYWHCEFSCSELNCSLKPAFVSVQPFQSLTSEPLTLSRVLQPHLSMPRWQKKWCLSSSKQQHSVPLQFILYAVPPPRWAPSARVNWLITRLTRFHASQILHPPRRNLRAKG